MLARPVLCACGLALHYSDPAIQAYVERAIDELGPTVVVSTAEGSWEVPRHYIALHGLELSALARLALLYHWVAVGGTWALIVLAML